MACKIVLTGVPVDGLKFDFATSRDLEIKDLEEVRMLGCSFLISGTKCYA